MAPFAWLTPDSIPTATICRRLIIPDDIDIITAVSGALDLLGQVGNWQQFGAVTPDEIAYAMQTMFWQYAETDAACMIGAILPYATDTTPDGTLYCDGATYQRVDYPALYAALASVFIVDADNFTVPDLRGRAAIGDGTGSGLTPRAIGDSFGEETHVLTIAELAAHAHTTIPHSHPEGIAVPAVAQITVVPQPSAVPGVGVTGLSGVTVNSTGNDTAHNNMQPSFALRYCIVAR